MIGIRRARPRDHLEQLLRVRRRWIVDVRVPTCEWLALPVSSWQLVGAAAVWTHVPASGPELELRFALAASSGDIAERIVARRLERFRLTVLESKRRPA